MLVLSRKKNDSIMVGSDIRVTVLSISNGRVKIGIEAPADVRVLRSELALEPETDSSVHPEPVWAACCDHVGQMDEACMSSF